MKIKFIGLWVALIFCATAVFAQNSGPELAKPSVDEWTSSIDSKSVELPKPSDDHRNTTIIRNLLKETEWFPKVNVNVSGGIVEFNGEIDDKAHLDWLVETVDRLPTVLAVINKTHLQKKPITDLSPAVDELKSSLDKTKRLLPRVAMGIILFLIFGFLSHFIRKSIQALWHRKTDNPFLLSNITKVTMLPIWALFVYLIFKTIGLTGLAATIVGGTGLLGIVLGFAFRGIAENYLSGVLLATRTPFTRGDQIKVANFEGIVQTLSMRGTTIIDFNGNYVLIPNSIIVNSAVENRSANPLTRGMFTITLTVETSIQEAKEIILSQLKKINHVLDKPSAFVDIDSIDPWNTKLRVYFWFDANKVDGTYLKIVAMDAVREGLFTSGVHLLDDVRQIAIREEKEQTTRASTKKYQHDDSINRSNRTSGANNDKKIQDQELLDCADQNPLHREKSEENMLK